MSETESLSKSGTQTRGRVSRLPKRTQHNDNSTHMGRPKRIMRRPQRLIESMKFIWTGNT